jgi:hypothetical protein
LFGEGRFDFGREVRRFDDSLVRGLGGVIAFYSFGSDFFFDEDFNGMAEEVVEESPSLGIKVAVQG